MSSLQSGGVQKITVTRITPKEASEFIDEKGKKYPKPAHVVLTGRAKVIELVDGMPDVFEKPIAITCWDLAAAASLAVGQAYEMCLYCQPKGKAGERVQWHLVFFTPLGGQSAQAAPKKPTP